MVLWVLRPLFAAAANQDVPDAALALDALSVPLFSSAVTALCSASLVADASLRDDLILATWNSLLSRPDCPSALLDTARILEAPPPPQPAALPRTLVPSPGDTVVADATGSLYTLESLSPLAILRSRSGDLFDHIPPSTLWFVSPHLDRGSQTHPRSQSQFRDVLTSVADSAGYLLADVDVALALTHFRIGLTSGWRSVALLDYSSRSHMRLRVFYRLTPSQLAYEDASIPSSVLSQLLPVIRAGHAGTAPASDYQEPLGPIPDVRVPVPDLIDPDSVTDAVPLSLTLPSSDDEPFINASHVALPSHDAPVASVDVACTCGRIRGVQGRHSLYCAITRTRASARVQRLYNPDADPLLVPIAAPHALPAVPSEHPLLPLPTLQEVVGCKIRLLSRVPSDARAAWSDTLRRVLVHLLVTTDPNRWHYYFLLPKIVLRLPSRSEGAPGHVVAQRCRRFAANQWGNVPQMWHEALQEVAPDIPHPATLGPLAAAPLPSHTLASLWDEHPPNIADESTLNRAMSLAHQGYFARSVSALAAAKVATPSEDTVAALQ
jgi:hypothetical protein